MYDPTEKKKRDGSLLTGEIAYMVRGFVAGGIPDYQISAMLAAVYFKGMDGREITNPTLEMTHSGSMVDLSPIKGIKADRHSTGGVGDKTTLVTGPITATCGVRVVKMSGRDLGRTGGIVDKLENIPRLRTAVPKEGFFRIVNEDGLALIGQSSNMVPIDKRLYALRGVTATVNGIPLIASSIMSKRLVVDSDCIVLNVKARSGAFVKTLEDSISLAREMVSIGTSVDRRRRTLVTNMDVPLSHAIGSSLEMEEAIETPKGRGPEDLVYVCLELAADIFHMVDRGNMGQCGKVAQGIMEDGSALRCLEPMVESQGGDDRYAENPGLFHRAFLSREVKASETGFITHMGMKGIGVVSVMLGAGRNKKEDTIDYSTGILLEKKYGDSVREGEAVAVLYASYEELSGLVMEGFLTSCTLGKQMPGPEPLIFAGISDTDVGRRTIEEKAP